MIAALLCNGPSRVLYNPSKEYDYVIGCNIPWSNVDATVIMDIEVIHTIMKNGLPLCKTFFSQDVWREMHHKHRSLYDTLFLGLIKPLDINDNSGHLACRKLIELGYTKIDVYGCDSMTSVNTDSYTHKYIDTRFADDNSLVSNWRRVWFDIISNNTVEISFIK